MNKLVNAAITVAGVCVGGVTVSQAAGSGRLAHMLAMVGLAAGVAALHLLRA